MKLLLAGATFLSVLSTASFAASCGSGEFGAKQFYDFATQLERRCAKGKVMNQKCGRLLEKSTCALNKGLVQISKAGLQGANCGTAIRMQRAGMAIFDEHSDYFEDLQFEGYSRLDATNKASFNKICGA